jgi:tetratricopeptide (TPR) repeat protein
MALAVAETPAVPMKRVQVIAGLALALLALPDARTTVQAQELASAVVVADSVEQSPESPREWYDLGLRLYESYRYRESIAAFERSLQLRVDAQSEGAWHIARAYAQLGNRTQAFRWLGHARQLGFRDDEAIRDEPAFRRYHDDPGFRSLVMPSSCSSCRVGATSTITML